MADRRLRLIIEAQNKAKEAFAQVEQNLQKMNTSVETVNKNMSASFGAVTAKMQSMGTAMTIGVTAPLVLLGRSAFKAYADMDSLKRGMIAVTGSSAAAAKEINRLKEVAKLPGLGFQEAIQGSVNLQAAGASADEARKYLSAFGNALATVGKGKAELDMVNLALTQLMNKASGFGQEIRQLQEQLPQIRQIMIKAFGTADSEEIAKMGITGKQFVDAIAAEFAKLPKMTGGPKNAMENLADVWTRSLARIGEVMAPVVIRVLGWLDKWLTLLEKMPKPILAFGLVLAGLAAAGGPILLFISGLFQTIYYFRELAIGAKLAEAAIKAYGIAAAGVNGAKIAFGMGAAGDAAGAVAGGTAAGAAAGGAAGWLGKAKGLLGRAVKVVPWGPKAAQVLSKAGPVGWIALAAGVTLATGMYMMNKSDYDQADDSEKALKKQEEALAKAGWTRDPKTGRMIPPAKPGKDPAALFRDAAFSPTSAGMMPFTPGASTASGKALTEPVYNYDDYSFADEQAVAREANAQEERRAAWRLSLAQASVGQTAAVVQELQARHNLFETLEQLAGEYAQGKDVTQRLALAYAEYNKASNDASLQQAQDSWNEYEKRVEAWAIKRGMAGDAAATKEAFLARIGTKRARSLAFATTQGDVDLANATYDKELKDFNDGEAKIAADKAKQQKADDYSLIESVINRVTQYRKEADAYIANVQRMIEADRERERSRIKWTSGESLWREANIQGASTRLNTPLPFYELRDNGSDPTDRELIQAFTDMKEELKAHKEKFDRMIDLLGPQAEGAAF